MIRHLLTLAAVVIVLGTIFTSPSEGQMIKYHIADGNFHGVTQAQSQSRIMEGFEELDRLTSKLRFQRVDSARKAKLRISFGNPDPKGTVIGAGTVSISRNRKDVIISRTSTAFSGRFSRNIETLAMHLALNSARFRFSTYAKVHRVVAIPAYPSFYQMEQIRKKYRAPKGEVVFFPTNLRWAALKHQYYVALHNENWAERRELLLIRDAATTADEMQEAQANVLINFTRLIGNKIPMSGAAAEWHYVNNSWMGFTNYINNGGLDPNHPDNGNADRGDHN